ncbi:MAG: putative metal-dependent hydrolase [Bacteroidota bacterium]
MDEQLRYPIGRFRAVKDLPQTEYPRLINEIAETPRRIRDAVKGLSDQQFDAPYRPGGWTVRQVVHHLPDSHLNAYIRFKLAMTEEHPTIKPYLEAVWAELPEAKSAPVEMSLVLLEALHTRWVTFLRSLRPEDFKRTLNHPENGTMTLDTVLQLYAWHGRHHEGHITSLKTRMKWQT